MLVSKKRAAEQPISERAKRTKTKDTTSQAQRPRLTTPDLEFEYDRTQLRDPRSKPGRTGEPRYEEDDIPVDLKERFDNDYYVPKPESGMFVEGSRSDPRDVFHNIHRCIDTGLMGHQLPTMLDSILITTRRCSGVNQELLPTSGMDEAIDQDRRDQEQMFDVFFTED
ncbi:hypothetical protein E4T43_01198 [Aureobasidium subglaciale]|nr:hypothetical protein E4T43_01198 [Aureobasidium subglaciale]